MADLKKMFLHISSLTAKELLVFGDVLGYDAVHTSRQIRTLITTSKSSSPPLEPQTSHTSICVYIAMLCDTAFSKPAATTKCHMGLNATHYMRICSSAI